MHSHRTRSIISKIAMVFCMSLLVHPPSVGQAIDTCTLAAGTAAGVSPQTTQSDKGVITVGCPKIWVSDRIFTVLDGMLRDVDSITLKSLQGLDPNSITGADLLSIATEFQANLKYDQGAAVGNALKLQKANAQRSAELKQYSIQQKSNEDVFQRQATLKARLLSLQEQDYQLASSGKDATDPQRKKIQDQQNLIDTQLGQLAKLTPGSSDSSSSSSGSPSQSPGSSITDQNISGSDTTQATAASTSLTALDQDALQKAFGDVLKSPKLPATMQMDNVIDLLRQRLAREFAVMYDDLSRESERYDIYLAQFDVGLIPGKNGKRQHPLVQISIGTQGVAYDLFPVGSAYNTSTGLAKTSRIGITGVAQTLFGFGLSAAYTRSRNQYRSSLTQTLYISALGAGTSRFGWSFGPAPFEDFVSAGNREVYAVLLVPKGMPRLTMNISACWLKDGRSRASDCSTAGPDMTFNLPDSATASQKLAGISYQPYNERTLPTGASSASQTPALPAGNTVQLVFTNPVDPNLTITVNDKILRRVRDVRGRALYGSADDKPGVLAGNDAESKALSKSRFGILESDSLDLDTWFQVNSRTVLLNISRDTAGTDIFPTIHVSDPRSGGRDVFEMAADKTDREHPTQVRIAEWKFTPKTLNGVRAAFSPLFTEPYGSGRIKAYIDEVSKANGNTQAVPKTIRIVSSTRRTGRTRPVWLHGQAQVVLEVSTLPDHPWALDCNEEEGSLECSMPSEQEYVDTAQLQHAQLKLWVDEPPYYERPGLWADTDLGRVNHAWNPEPYTVTDWAEVHEVCHNFTDAFSSEICKKTPWNAWEANIAVRNLDVNGATTYCVSGLPDTNLLLTAQKTLEEEARKGNNPAISKEVSRVKDLLRVSKQSPMIETAKAPDVKQGNNSPKNEDKATNHKCSHSPVIASKSPEGEFLSLIIPFEALPYLGDSITIEPDCIGTSASCQQLLLPNLKNRLLPGPVTLIDLKSGRYRLQGEHLQAVTTIRLVSDGKAHDLSVVPGINNVDFFVDSDKSKLEPGSYGVYLLLNEVPVPAAYEDDKKNIQPLTLAIPKTQESPAPPANPAPPKSPEKPKG